MCGPPGPSHLIHRLTIAYDLLKAMVVMAFARHRRRHENGRVYSNLGEKVDIWLSNKMPLRTSLILLKYAWHNKTVMWFFATTESEVTDIIAWRERAWICFEKVRDERAV